MKPRRGLIVDYQDHNGPLAAIIVEVNDGGMATLFVLGKLQADYRYRVPPSDTREMGTWAMPPEVDS